MAASTLYTLLVKLGFDVSDLQAGGASARSTLSSVGAAAQNLAATAAPATAAVRSLGSAGASTASQLQALVTAEQAAANAMKARTAAAGPLVSAQQAQTSAMKASYAAAGSLASAQQMAVDAAKAQSAASGGLVTAQQAAANAMRASYAAAGPLSTGLRTAEGAMAAAAPAANLAAAGFVRAGEGAASLGPIVNKAGQAISSMNSQLNQTPGAAMRASTAVKSIGAAVEDTSRKAGFLQRTLSMAFAFGGGVAVTTAIGFIGNALLGFNSRLQQAHIAFETLLGSGGDADKFIKQMEDFANVTPFDFQGVQESTQRLMAMGFTAEQVLPTLRAVGDAVAGLGGSADKLDRVTIALGQMMTAGRVNSQDMRQLTEAGIPAWQFLADAIHKTVGEARTLAEKGLIPSAQAIPAILEGMDKKFGGLMAKQARTAQGAFSTIRDAALQTISGAIEPLFNLLTQGLASLADFFIAGGGKYFIPMIYAIGIAIGAFLIPRLISLIGTIGALRVEMLGVAVPLLPLITLVYAFGLAWQENMGGIQTTLGPVVKGVADFAGGILQAASSAGLLIPALEIIATIIGVKMVGSLVMAGIAMAADTVGAIAFAVALGGLGTGAMGAAAGIGALSTGLTAAGAVLATLALPIAAIIAALSLLLLNWDRVGQGLRVLEFAFLGAVEMFLRGASVLPFVGDGFKGMADGIHEAQMGVARDMAAMEQHIHDLEAAANKTPGTAASTPADFQKLLDSFRNGVSGIKAESQKLVDVFGTSLQGVIAAAKEAGGAMMTEMAKGIMEHQNAPLDAMQQLHDLLRTALSPEAEIARNVGILQSQELAAGLASSIPAVRAAAEGARKAAQERLDELTNGAYSAGQNTTVKIAAGMMDPKAVAAISDAANKVLMPVATVMDKLFGGTTASDMVTKLTGSLNGMSHQMAVAKDWNDKYAPSAQAVAAAQKSMNDQLSATARSQGLSALNTAFNEIQASAHKFFDQMHQDNLKLIDDALKHKNALLDAKEALNQAPVTAAQKALDFQRKAIEEWRLRQAVSHASSPEQYRDAVLALRDFLAQKHIDEMQAQVDSSKSVLDAQKQRNSDLAGVQREAENRRYDMQQQAFDRELELLRRYLAKHPEEWANTEGKIMKLLNSYGISYHTAGSSLGGYFVAGLREQLGAAIAAVKQMADLIPGLAGMLDVGTAPFGSDLAALNAGSYPGSTKPGSTINYAPYQPKPYVPPTSSSSYGGGGGQAPKMLADGAWRIMKDNMLASLHADEMVLPPDVGVLARQFASKKISPTDAFQRFDARSSMGGGGGGTIIFQVGEEVLGEATDRGLQIQGNVYGNHRRVKVRSSR